MRYIATGRKMGRPTGNLVVRMTQAECAEILGLSKVSIQRIEARALRKLRRGLAAWGPEQKGARR